MSGKKRAVLLLAASLALAGCGYTTKSLLPENIRRVNVPPVKNAIDLSSEISDKTPFRVYRPGLEVEITNAVINRFIFDGQLKVVSADKADATFSAALVDYRRDALRYSAGEDIQEYRLSIVLDAALLQKSDNKVLWKERLTGDTTFFLSGPRAVSEDEAAAKAVEDLARRVVEKTVEYW
jgi:outer membrane lipopolysaccharide assembly protein LptE/RlpB